MPVIATCGHQLEDGDMDGNMIATADYNREGERVISHQCVCDLCFKEYKKKKLILTKRRQDNWLRNRTFIFWSKSTGYLQPVKAKNIEAAKLMLTKKHPNVNDWELETPKSKQN